MKIMKVAAASLAAISLSLTLPAIATSQPIPDADLGVDLGSGITAWYQMEAQQVGLKNDCLTAVKKWRKDALDTKVRWPNPQGKPIGEYLSAKGISEAEYLNPKWAQDLEYIALARATELSSHNLFDHVRPNGQRYDTVGRSGATYWSECLAAGVATCGAAIDLYASEKPDWVNRTGGVTGHYEQLINPEHTHYGAGVAPATDGLGGQWNYTWAHYAGRLPQKVNDAGTNLSGQHWFQVQLANATLDESITITPDTITVGERVAPDAVTNAYFGRFHLRGTWQTDNPAVAKIDQQGNLVGVIPGKTRVILRLKEGPDWATSLRVLRGAVERNGGNSRYATAVSFSSAHLPDGAKTVFLASGESYPDALAASAVAASTSSPVLLTQHNKIPPEVAREIQRLQPSRIIVAGGPGAVSDAVQAQARALVDGAQTQRVGGSHRFETAANLARGWFDSNVKTVYLASGMDFPDALAAAAAAGSQHGPVLLTLPDELPNDTATALAEFNPSRIVIVGGEGVVSPAVVAQLRHQLPNADIARHGGANRFETAKAVADREFSPQATRVVVANAFNYPDALVGAAIAGMNHSPVLLTSPTELPATMQAALKKLQPLNVSVAGGKAVVSEAVRQKIAAVTELLLR